MERFKVACCQLQAHDLADAEQSLQSMLRALDQAAEAGAQLALLPECSYPAYYLGSRDPYSAPGVRPYAEVLGLLQAKARQHGLWIAAGLAVPHADGTLTNSGVVVTPAGDVAGRYDKSFLWHFDNRWFEPGSEFPVFDAGFCKFGILICADARLPEIARMLRVNGSEVICDLTAWVSWARRPEELSTTQCEYLVPMRAFENGTWFAAADKWGPEADSIVYAGRSTVIDPSGVARVCAPAIGDAVVVYEIEPMEAKPVPRRPALYGGLVRPTSTLPAMRLEREPLVPAEAHGRVAVVPGSTDIDMARLARQFADLREQDCDIVVFGGTSGPEGWEVRLPELEAAVKAHGGAAVVAVATSGCNWRQSAAVVTPSRTFEHLASHGRGIDTGEALPPVIPTPAGNIGLLVGDEMFVPEVARCLALDGADILAWASFEAHPMNERAARTRSDENRVYTAGAWPGGGIVTNPDGALVTAVPEGLDVAMAASTHLAFSRWKERAPQTHVIRDRTPGAYGALVK